MRNSAPQGAHKAGVGDTEILGEEVSPDLRVPPSLSAREESRQQNGQSGRAAARPPEQEEKGLHYLEAANVLLARWKVLIGIMIPVLAGIWNRIRAHTLLKKVDHLDKRVDHLDKRVDEGLTDLGQRVDEGIKDLGQRVDEGIKDLGQRVQKMERIAELVERLLAERETDRSS